MKTLPLVLFAIVLAIVGCGTPNPAAYSGKRTMLLDQAPGSNDKFVTAIRPNTKVRPTEFIGNRPTMAEADLDAAGVPSKEIRYVKAGEKLRLSETNAPDAK